MISKPFNPILVSLLIPHVLAALQHRPPSAQPQDPFANPKFQVSFLNHHPISTTEAKAWQIDPEAVWVEKMGKGELGDIGGLFMGDELAVLAAAEQSNRDRKEQKTLDDGQPVTDEVSPPKVHYTPSFIPMQLPSPLPQEESRSYLCMLPHPLSTKPPERTLEEEAKKKEEAVADPLIGWQSLKHLDGTCLYSKQGWFTYSYCHNSHVRQFREAPHAHPHPPGGHVPKEDMNYEAYNLGLSPLLLQKQSPSTTPSTAPPDPAVSLSQNAHNRYLVQHWGSGTPCDKTMGPRTVEIQFHCRMGGIDGIGFVKEISTCKYVLVIYTPNLCSLPGFSAPTPQDTPSHPIKCRPIVSDSSILTLQKSLSNELHWRERRLFREDDGTLPDGGLSEKETVALMVRDRRSQGDKYPKGYFPTQAYYKAPPRREEYAGAKGTLQLPKDLEGLLGGDLVDQLGGIFQQKLGGDVGMDDETMVFSLGNMDEIDDLGEMEVVVDGKVVRVKAMVVTSGQGVEDEQLDLDPMTLDEEIELLMEELVRKQKEKAERMEGSGGQVGERREQLLKKLLTEGHDEETYEEFKKETEKLERERGRVEV